MRWVILGVVSLTALLLRYAALGRLLPASAANTTGGDSFALPLQSLGFALASLYAPVRRLAMEPDPASLSLMHVGVGVVVAAALWVLAWRIDPAARGLLRRAAIATGVCVLPVLNWIPQETRLSERFLYLASGFALVPFGVLVHIAWRRGSAVRPVVAGATALVLVLLLGISAWRARAWRDDIVLWRIATAEEPQRALFWQRYGLALMQRRMFGESERALQRAIELDPRDFNANQYLGMVYHQTDRPASAITQYGKALELQPRNVYLLLNIALSRLAIADVRGAYDLAKQALAIDSNHFEALRLAGGLAMQLGLLPESRRYLESAQRQQPQNVALRQQFEVLVRREAGLESARGPVGSIVPGPGTAPDSAGAAPVPVPAPGR
jgi:tetratricopeptide (TPR) repeat protein